MRYRVVFWDSGGTIFHSSDRPGGFAGSPSPSEVRGRRACRAGLSLEMFGHSPPPGLTRLITELESDLSAALGARYSLEMLAEHLYSALGIPPRKEEVLFLAGALGGPRYSAWLWDGVAGALAAMHRAGVRMGVIANTAWTGGMMRRALEGVGLAGFFESVVCSCDIGIQKPDPGIFAAALGGLNPPVPSGEPVLYVGDSIPKDVEGAVGFGWEAALHLTSSGDVSEKCVLAFRDYEELAGMVLDGGPRPL